MTDSDDLRARLATFTADRDWGQFHRPKNLVMALAGEVGELVAEFQWLTPEESEAVMADPAHGARVRSEMADVFVYLTQLAMRLDIDLYEVAHEKMDEVEVRYPPGVVPRSAGPTAPSVED
ncbi:nucleotide pyrophosphohydrolase [Longispora fulva]|uniref:NTP pyrophosphatase (Non-canonical NTP hydrolase) n=1 Tax=Longispora fulva TaxID=619741 RepID=A0A8J7GJA3_9ACTN|nr:nucleotide pyrophosphohydrolase [Longispora fulva]MBG6140349.1 NTP pyrophosphatase (non-canonical NTP hydrolase) [Longispora fulva]GIG57270.1 nucleotide pyrophosphohydrolase [Longispora fulva]